MAASDTVASPMPLLADIRHPIQGDNPCGADVTYDEEFQTVKAEISRLENIDYPMIVDVSRRLLVDRTKDLRVVGYLVVGLLYTRGISGMAEGLAVFKGVITDFWEGLFPEPKRETARRNAIQFMVTRLENRLKRFELKVSDLEPLRISLATLRELEPFLMERMGEQAPVLSPLILDLEEAVRRVTKRAEKQADAVSPPGEQAAPPAEKGEEGSEEGEEEKPSRLQQLGLRLLKRDKWDTVPQARLSVQRAANFIRSQDGKNPVPYRLMRALCWGGLQEMPNHTEGKTEIPPPSHENRTMLASQLEQADRPGAWEKLLARAEGLMAEHALWLDLQYMVVTAMEKLGEEYAVARRGILWEISFLLERVPQLTQFTFRDGTPFASPLTADWLGEVAAVAEEEDEDGVESDGEVEAEGGERQEAQELFRRGDLSGALELLQVGLDRERSGEARFDRRLFMASLCMRGNQPAVARPLLERLAEEVGEFSLARWKPALALEAWMLLYRCYVQLAERPGASNGPALREKAEGIFDKICRLDVRYALAQAKETDGKSTPESGARPKVRKVRPRKKR